MLYFLIAIIICGVPQGSILGPTLFNCYINDLVLSMRGIDTCISLYADDAVIFRSDTDCRSLKTHLETCLSIVLNWSNQNHINFNVQKTKFCIYGYRSLISKFNGKLIYANGVKISRCTQYRYLGVDLDECMTLSANFNSTFKKYSYKIFQFGKMRKYLDIRTRTLVYKQTILLLVEYVSFMLCLNSSCDAEKLQKLQNSYRCLRSCFNVYCPIDRGTQRLHNDARVNTLSVRRDVQLLNIMFFLKTNEKYQKGSVCVTRNIDRYLFKTEIVHKDFGTRYQWGIRT